VSVECETIEPTQTRLMARTANWTRSDRLRRMVDTIVDEVEPTRIVLFGSQARGDATAASDFDLLVIVDESVLNGRERVDMMTHLWRALSDIRGPKDVLVYSLEEVDKWTEASNHVIARALREGEVVYER